MRLPAQAQAFVQKLTPRQRQWGMLGAILFAAVGVLWAVFSVTQSRTGPVAARAAASPPAKVTNVGVMAGGAQLTPQDQWMGAAGRKLSQYEHDRAEQDKFNKDRQSFEQQVQQRFGKLEEQLRAQSAAPSAPAGEPAVPPYPPQSALQAAVTQKLPPPPPPPSAQTLGPSPGMPPGTPLTLHDPAVASLVRVSLGEATKAGPQTPSPASSAKTGTDATTGSVESYLPVSFTRGILLGGLDAPTGGQSQSNPHPVLIRLEDNAVLPNRYRSNVRECFVIAAGYGDISAERAYLRTESLSCVRSDGTTIEVKIQGSVYGEDGLVGIRGRLITKQGQMLANALLAGVVSGIGQGIATTGSTVTQSAFGTISTASGSDAFKQGVGNGIGTALDRLAQYYIKLAEGTFPVIEVDAGRQVDVVITKGVRIEGGGLTQTGAEEGPPREHPQGLFAAGADDAY